jgi:hypothetical protein
MTPQERREERQKWCETHRQPLRWNLNRSYLCCGVPECKWSNQSHGGGRHPQSERPISEQDTPTDS